MSDSRAEKVGIRTELSDERGAAVGELLARVVDVPAVATLADELSSTGSSSRASKNASGGTEERDGGDDKLGEEHGLLAERLRVLRAVRLRTKFAKSVKRAIL